MRPQLLKLPFLNDSTIYHDRYECDYFDRPWHFHKELELVYIIKSTGTKFIGNQVRPFGEGDLTLIGADIPHLFRNDNTYYEGQQKQIASSVFLHFSPTFLGKHFFEIPEFKGIKKLIADASLGLQVEGQTRSQVAEILLKMEMEDVSGKLISVLQILDILSKSKSLKPILATAFVGKSDHDADRINKVFDYIMLNYTKEIYLKDIADQLHMSTAAFSRYFKAHTLRTFSDYVTKIRINHACKLLMEHNYSVSEIGFMSGFENRANFYRHFKNHMGVVPKEFAQRLRK